MSTTTSIGLPQWASRLLSELSDADRRALSLATGLNPVQLNWQPRPGAWSIGQCLDHLRASNELMVETISAALEGQRLDPVDKITLGWFSGWFIRNYVAPNPGGKRAPAPKKVVPVQAVDPNILQAFLRTTEAARNLIQRASRHDVNRVRYRNPFVPLLRFTTGAGLEIIAKHSMRHLLQAEAVKQSPGFPG